MPLNRPYTFELAAMALAEPGQHNDIKALAERNGVDPDHFERATVILKGIGATGERSTTLCAANTSWTAGCMATCRWTSPSDPSLTVWKLGQFAEAFYRT